MISRKLRLEMCMMLSGKINKDDMSSSKLTVFFRPGFYVTFWQLSTYDLTPPGSKYDEEGAALRTLSRSEDSKYIAADRSADRAKRLTAGTHRSKRDRYNVFVNTLAQEFKEQTVSREFTMKRLGREKQHWFAHCEFVAMCCL
jgi:THO complex subunit 2